MTVFFSLRKQCIILFTVKYFTVSYNQADDHVS